jgi:hypothetical protein
MTKKNPFPGMSPFFEQRWRDAHTRLIAHVCEKLSELLPPDLVAAAEEEVVAIGGGEKDQGYRPDVSVWELRESSGGVATLRAPRASTPTCIIFDEVLDRWIEIRDVTGRLITVIELFSPSNKQDEAAREKYRRKRRTLINGRVNIVEIDLVRGGGSLFPTEVLEVKRKKGGCYGICVYRATQPGELDFYSIPLREALPIISIPLRPNEPEIALELQPLIDLCHERGRYHLLRYDLELDPPLPESDRKWVQEILGEYKK